HTVTVDWADGTAASFEILASGATSFTFTHTYAGTAPGQPIASYTVTATVSDSFGGSATTTATVQVANVAPTVSAGGDQLIDIGDPFQRPGSFADPGANQFSATVDYGDGSGVQPLALDSNHTFFLQHGYAGPGSFVVTVTVSDDRGGVGAA